MSSAPKKDLILAIDGPAGAGKSTVARGAATQLGFRFLDTGAIYRAATLATMRAGIDLAAPDLNPKSVTSVVAACKLEMELDRDVTKQVRVRLDGDDVSAEIRTEHVTSNIRYVADIREVREIATQFQRKFASDGRIVSEGRDQGTVVFPNAFLKVYLWASPEERARRRYLELKGTPEETPEAELAQRIRVRDRLDMSRELGALKRAMDAVDLDSTTMSIQQATDEIVKMARERMAMLGLA